MQSSEITKALENIYAALRRNHPELPEKAIGVTELKRGRWGDYGTRWIAGERHIRVATSCLAAGAECATEILIHEAAHALAEVRGVKETSRQNRYHNKGFALIAQELGLRAPEQPHPVIGWSDCEITSETLRLYAKQVAALGRVLRRD